MRNNEGVRGAGRGGCSEEGACGESFLHYLLYHHFDAEVLIVFTISLTHAKNGEREEIETMKVCEYMYIGEFEGVAVESQESH